MFKLTKHFDKTLAKKVQTPNFSQHTHLIHMQLSDLKPYNCINEENTTKSQGFHHRLGVARIPEQSDTRTE